MTFSFRNLPICPNFEPEPETKYYLALLGDPKHTLEQLRYSIRCQNFDLNISKIVHR